MEFQNAVHDLELAKIFCLPLRPKAGETNAAGFGAAERWSGGAVEQWSERSGVVCIAAWALPCVRSPSWKMNNDIRLSSSQPVVPFKTFTQAKPRAALE